MTRASRPTLTSHLLAWTLASLLLVWTTFMLVGYRTGEHEADELTDGHLAGVAALLLAYGPAQPGGDPAPRLPPPDTELKAHDYQQSMSVVFWDAAGRPLSASGDAPRLAVPPSPGFATLRLGQPARPWRAFTRWSARHDLQVTVLLSLRERDDLASDIAEQVTEPGLWLLPVIALVLGMAIRRGLRPLYALSQEVLRLDVRRGDPLATRQRHEELRVLVEAINKLVERYHAALTRERTLASEFAHELRTPLTSLALQAHALRTAPPGEADALLVRLEQDALRAGEVLSHLLALARASRTELQEASEPCFLRPIAQRLLAEFAPAAADSGHELALAGEQDLQVQGHPLLLELALRNLLENAIAHTPPGTQVEVEVDAAARAIQVCDIPPAGEGSSAAGAPLGLGLGLRVVEKVAAIHGARCEALPNPRGAGSCYRLVFPPLPQE